MRQSKKIAVGGMISALSLLIMFLSVIPATNYAVPALAGIFLVVIAVEIDFKVSVASYAAVSILSFFMAPQKEAWAFFVFLFGYYPVLKLKLDLIRNKAVRIVLKQLIFNAAVIAAVWLLMAAFAIKMSGYTFGVSGQWGLVLMLLMGNIAFVLYDMALTNLVYLYRVRIHPKVKKMLGS